MCTAFIISGAIYAFSRFWTEMMSVPVRDFLCLSQLPWTILIAHLSRSNLGDAGNQRAELTRSCLPFHVGTARFSTSKKVLPAGCPSQHHKLVLRSCFDEQIHIQLIKLQVLVVGSSCILCWSHGRFIESRIWR